MVLVTLSRHPHIGTSPSVFALRLEVGVDRCARSRIIAARSKDERTIGGMRDGNIPSMIMVVSQRATVATVVRSNNLCEHSIGIRSR